MSFRNIILGNSFTRGQIIVSMVSHTSFHIYIHYMFDTITAHDLKGETQSQDITIQSNDLALMQYYGISTRRVNHSNV